MAKKISPRQVPDRDDKYMGLAWIHAGFSKDPNTQVGAQIVTHNNIPLGSGYNGPPSSIDDHSFSWNRPPKNDPEAFSKYDVIIHAEINAIKHSLSMNYDLSYTTFYVTAFPCKSCMLNIVSNDIKNIVYMDYKSEKGSLLQNTKGRDSAMKIAKLANINVRAFGGNIGWIEDWADNLREMGVFEI